RAQGNSESSQGFQEGDERFPVVIREIGAELVSRVRRPEGTRVCDEPIVPERCGPVSLMVQQIFERWNVVVVEVRRAPSDAREAARRIPVAIADVEAARRDE